MFAFWIVSRYAGVKWGLSVDHPDELRARAEEVLRSLREKDYDRPVFIEFSGTPKSGKSTCIDIVGHFFRRLDYNVLAPTEGASKRTPYFLKDNLMAFNTWSASYALMYVLEGIHGSDKFDLAVLDRGLFDALAWFQILGNKDEITREVRDKVHEFLLIEEWRSNIDAVLLFTTDPETSLKREGLHKIIQEEGRAMNPDFLPELNAAYEQVREEHSEEFARFELIDTSDEQGTTPRSTAEEAVAFILDIFDSRLAADGVA